MAPAGPSGPPGQWIVVGPRTRAQMGAVLEQALGTVWVALLETSGVADGTPYALVISEAHLEPRPNGAPTGTGPGGGAGPADGAQDGAP